MSAKRQRRKRRQRARLQESALAETTPNSGAEGTPRGHERREVTLIRPGWGSSGYYAAEVLERDGPTAWPEGTHMYLNHPSKSEETDRPERDVRDLAAVLASTPTVKDGALVAEAAVLEHWAPVIDQLAPHIGVSIRAMGEMEQGEAEGREGPIIRSIDEGISVDFVTKAGAGGEVGALIESARAHTTSEGAQPLTEETGGLRDRETSKEDDMSDADKQRLADLEETVGKLQEQVKTSESERDEAKADKERAEDALLRVRAEKVVAEATTQPGDSEKPVSAFEDLPERAVGRVKEAALKGELPMTEDGKLDEERLCERTIKAAKEEREYLSEAGAAPKSNPVTGMGGRATEVKDGDELAKSFQRLGLDESAAKTAAEGR